MTAVLLCERHQMVVKSMLCHPEVTYCGIQVVNVKEKSTWVSRVILIGKKVILITFFKS